MGTILQDMMGMLSRKKVVTPRTDDYITLARYAGAQERMKPHPKVETELVTMGSIKTFVNTGGTPSLPLTGGTISGNLTIDGALTLKVNSGFANISTDVTGTIFIGNTSAGVTTGLNITGDIAMQGTNASITLTSPTGAIYMTSPDGTVYKVQMANGGTFDITEV
jgi:hypothetical protein